MLRILDDLDCRLYYDLDDKKFHYHAGIGIGEEHTQEAIKRLRKEIEVINYLQNLKYLKSIVDEETRFGVLFP